MSKQEQRGMVMNQMLLATTKNRKLWKGHGISKKEETLQLSENN